MNDTEHKTLWFTKLLTSLPRLRSSSQPINDTFISRNPTVSENYRVLGGNSTIVVASTHSTSGVPPILLLYMLPAQEAK